MGIHSRRVGRTIACGVVSLGLAAGSLTLAGGAAAQTQIVDPNAAKAGQSPHDAALDAARRGDYIAAVDLAKQAAAAGQPLDADQLDYMTGKAAQQQSVLDAAAKVKAAQVAAAATADQIQQRQQKDYAAAQAALERRKRLAEDDQPTAATMGQQGMQLGNFSSDRSSSYTNNNGAQRQTADNVDSPNSSKFGSNQPLTGTVQGRFATSCLSFNNDPTGAGTVATNTCAYKVVFLWCVQGGSNRACAKDGVPPPARNEVAAHGSLTLSDRTAGLPVKTWACESPSIPQAVESASAGFACK